MNCPIPKELNLLWKNVVNAIKLLKSVRLENTKPCLFDRLVSLGLEHHVSLKLAFIILDMSQADL